MIQIKENDLLKVDKDGLIDLIDNNTDSKSNEIDNQLLNMIMRCYGRTTVKQSKWILEKVKFVIRHNKKYTKLRGIKDIRFL